MSRKYYTLDVFTNSVLSGNPLAVVLDSHGLTSDDMQAIAGEFNLSETVFVGNWSQDEKQVDIRIFTPKAELPFAGHPTIGTAVLLASLSGLGEGEKRKLTLVEKVGPVSCYISRIGENYEAKFDLPKMPIRRDLNVAAPQIAGALGLSSEDIGMEGHAAAVCSAGNAMPVVPISGLAAMQRIQVDEVELAKILEPAGVEPEMYVYTKECFNSDCHYHSRLFAPAMGIAEDPATGGAAAAMVAQIMACDHPGDGDHVFNIEQGIEMGRPSRIQIFIEVGNGELQKASISGNAIIVSKGELFV